MGTKRTTTDQRLHRAVGPAERPGAGARRPASGGRAGNRVASHRIQAKMQVGAAGDVYEREADRMAGEVVARLAQGDSAGPAAAGPVAAPAPTVQRTGGSAGGFAAPEHVVAGIEAARGGGQPLGGPHLGRMQQAFDADFSGVRIHTDGRADDLARSIDARAFTTGNDMFFRSGEFQPDTPDGQHVLAHELTHTLQQGDGVQRTIQRFAITENPPKLSEATKMKRAGSGLTGAFLLWKGADGLAVKFHADNPGRVLLAEQIMSDNGVSTPSTRAFDGPTLYRELSLAWLNISGSLSESEQAAGWTLLEQFGEEPWGLVMQMNKGRSFGDQIADAADAKDDQAIVNLWSDPHMLMQLGEVVAIDAFLGNADRFSMHSARGGPGDPIAFMNHGNWMTYVESERTRVETLDNDSMLGAFNEMTDGKTTDDIRKWVGKNIRGSAYLSDKHGRNLASIETLFDPQQFIDALQRFIADDGGFKWPKAMEQLSWNVTGRYLAYGINNARQRIMANLDRYMGMMSNLHGQFGSDGAFDPQAMQDRIDYLKMREGGATEADAIEALEVGALGNTGLLASLLADLLVFDPQWEQVTSEPRKGGMLKQAKRKLGRSASTQSKNNLTALDKMLGDGSWVKGLTAAQADTVIEIARGDTGDTYVTGQLITRAEIIRGLQFERARGEALSAASQQLARVTSKLGDDGRAGEIAAQTATAAQNIMAPKDPKKPLLGDHVEPLFSRFTTNARAATTNVPARNAVGQEFAAFSRGADSFNTEWTKLAQAQARRAMALRNDGGRRRRPARVGGR